MGILCAKNLDRIRPSRASRCGFAFCACLMTTMTLAFGDGPIRTYLDPARDACTRPTDHGPQLSFDNNPNRLSDILQLHLMRWAPTDPAVDLFAGAADSAGEFFRFDLVVRGLVNPPGRTEPAYFDPFAYGNRPIYGFVEFDMDDDADTGGETFAPEYRYLGNVSRFGGRAQKAKLADRVALDGFAFDEQFLTPPYVERSGEEFHLALLGGLTVTNGVIYRVGNHNRIFESGEEWQLRGRFFHRAHGFEPFSFVLGGTVAGAYDPIVDILFRHDNTADRTWITLVVPLTNVGAAQIGNTEPQANNADVSDQASILEALDDLALSAFFLQGFPSGLVEQALIDGWAERDPLAYLDPHEWDVTALVGISYAMPDPTGVFFVWTDIYPNVVSGDLDGSGKHEGLDTQLLNQYILQNDLQDGILDSQVVLSSFAAGFSLYDVNYDGVVSEVDSTPVIPTPDADGDGDADLADFAALQKCFLPGVTATPSCFAMDVFGDGGVDLNDLGAMTFNWTGPVPAAAQ